MKNEFKKANELYVKKYNQEFKKTGVFWAFGINQFNENKTHKKAPNNEYISIGGGGYIHKSNKEKLNYFYKEIAPKLKKEFLNSINMDELIEYELVNHECYYTGDWYSIIDLIKEYYPNIDADKEIKRIYDSTKEEKWELMGL